MDIRRGKENDYFNENFGELMVSACKLTKEFVIFLKFSLNLALETK